MRTRCPHLRAVPALLAALAAAACGELPLPTEVEPAGEPGPPIYTAAGPFRSSGHPVTGGAAYELDEAGTAALALTPGFSIPDVPDVSIFLSDSGRIEDGVKVGELAASSGAQRWTFRVPRGAVWRWAVLWSEELRVEVARARLAP